MRRHVAVLVEADCPHTVSSSVGLKPPQRCGVLPRSATGAGLPCERSLEVHQHAELGEDDRSFRVAVKPDDLAVRVEFEDIGARGVHLLSGSGQLAEGQLQRPVVGARKGELDDNNTAVGVDAAEFAMHVGERGSVIPDRFGEIAAAVGCAHAIVGEFTIGGEQRDPAFEVFAFGDPVCVEQLRRSR